MAVSYDVFSEPYNFCDADCERCPLARTCAVRLLELKSRREHVSRGEDPDDPAMVMADVADSLSNAFGLLLEEAEREGIDLDGPVPVVPVLPEAERLREAGLALACAVRQLAPREPPAVELANDAPELHEIGRLIRSSLMIASKSARIAGYLELEHPAAPTTEPIEQETSDEDDSRSAWIADGIPNLLLIDLLRDDIRTGLDWLLEQGAHGIAQFEAAFAKLNEILEPLIARIDPEHRSLFSGLIEDGAAPSPFCTVEHAKAHRPTSSN